MSTTLPDAGPQSAWPGEMDFKEPSREGGVSLGRLFFGHKLLLAIAAIAGGVLGYLQYTKATPQYASSAQVLVTRNEVRVPVEGAISEPRRSPIDTHLALLKTPVILTRAVETANLTETTQTLASAKDPAKALAGRLTATKSPTSDEIITLRFECADPEDCRTILNAVIVAYTDFLDDSQESVTKRTKELITEKKDALFAELKQKQEQYQAFVESSQLVWNGDEATNIHQQRLAQIEDERLNTRLERAGVDAELKSIAQAEADGVDPEAILMMALGDMPKAPPAEPTETAAEEPLPPIVPRPVVTEPLEIAEDNVEKSLLPLLVEEEIMATTHGRNHPDLVKLRRKIEVTRKLLEEDAAEKKRIAEQNQRVRNAQIAALEAARQKEIERTEQIAAARARELQASRLGIGGMDPEEVIGVYVTSLKTSRDVLDRKLAELQEQHQVEEAAARVVSIDLTRDRVLREEIAQVKRFFDALVDELREISLIEDGTLLSATPVSEPATGWKVAPRVADYLVFGSVLGLLGGLLIALLLELSDQSFRGPEQITDQLRLPVLGHVPKIEGGKADAAVAKLGKRGIDRSIVSYHRPKSRFAEAYRAIRVPLLFGAKHDDVRILQVTSPDPGDGKSTLAANLAVVMANSGKRTLIIDCDVHRPKMHKLFGLECGMGITDLIRDQAELPDVTHSGLVEGLDHITAGRRSKNISELILSRRFDEILMLLRDKYDYIILDSPPVLAVTDASALAAKADAVLLTLRITKQVQVHANRAKEMLDLVNARLLGIVVNGVSGAGAGNYGAGVFSAKSSKYSYVSGGGYGGRYYYDYQKYYQDDPDSSRGTIADDDAADEAPETVGSAG